MEEKIDLEFIKKSFKYALLRMEELDLSNWGSYELKQKRIAEVREKQQKTLEILKKLK